MGVKTLQIAFSGGIELLFDGQRSLTLQLDEGVRTVRDLLVHLREHHLRERPELFVSGATVRAGVLVLINDADWELEGELEYELQDKDTITFISTLHGG